ncbi:MAG: PGN_0703 family putative restriction endonuclease [Gaiellaceae bacterium]
MDQALLEAAHCWENDDKVPGPPELTAFRRRVRFQQAQWRERHGHPIGTQPIVPKPGKPSRPVGSRIPLDYARDTGANFLTSGARDAARARTSSPEPHQTFDHQRFWADLLWSPALAVNLFGDLAADLSSADRAVHAWWPDAPGTVAAVRFEHSPGRLDPEYLNSLRTFDVVFELDRLNGTRAVLAVDVKYHEWLKPETPRPENMLRYLEVARRSGAFGKGAPEDLARRGPLAVMWLEHLLLLSMLQRPSQRWSWGRYVVLSPRDNIGVAEGCARYRELLTDSSTFAPLELEELLQGSALPKGTSTRLRERYLPA